MNITSTLPVYAQVLKTIIVLSRCVTITDSYYWCRRSYHFTFQLQVLQQILRHKALGFILDNFLPKQLPYGVEEGKLVIRCSKLSVHLRHEFLACAILRGFLSTKTSILCLPHNRSTEKLRVCDVAGAANELLRNSGT